MKMRQVPGSGLLFDLASQSVDAYARKTPLLDLRRYLDGPLTASGVFIGLSGHAQRRFTIEMNGSWTGNSGRLEERFRYDDGETGERCWELEFAGDGEFSATAHDVPGVAKGAQSGNVAAMRYRLRVPRKSGEVVVSMQDWLYLIDDGTLINRARMSKFGLKVGEIIACFRRGEASPQGAAQP